MGAGLLDPPFPGWREKEKSLGSLWSPPMLSVPKAEKRSTLSSSALRASSVGDTSASAPSALALVSPDVPADAGKSGETVPITPAWGKGGDLGTRDTAFRRLSQHPRIHSFQTR